MTMNLLAMRDRQYDNEDNCADDGDNCWDCGEPNEGTMGFNMCSRCRHTICSDCEHQHLSGRREDDLPCPWESWIDTSRVL
jgi:hypothetical protein